MLEQDKFSVESLLETSELVNKGIDLLLWTNLFQFSFFHQIFVTTMNSKHHFFFQLKKELQSKNERLKKNI